MPAERYRKQATECMEAADRASDPGHKLSFLELARCWLRLAEKPKARHCGCPDPASRA
jgi:hypothetical protein